MGLSRLSPARTSGDRQILVPNGSLYKNAELQTYRFYAMLDVARVNTMKTIICYYVTPCSRVAGQSTGLTMCQRQCNEVRSAEQSASGHFNCSY